MPIMQNDRIYSVPNEKNPVWAGIAFLCVGVGIFAILKKDFDFSILMFLIGIVFFVLWGPRKISDYKIIIGGDELFFSPYLIDKKEIRLNWKSIKEITEHTIEEPRIKFAVEPKRYILFKTLEGKSYFMNRRFPIECEKDILETASILGIEVRGFSDITHS